MTASPTLLVTLLLFIAYFALLAWALRRPRQTVQGPWLFFLRAFFPNWKFFHAVGRAPRLYVRGHDAQGWCDWQLVYPRQRRRLLHVLHNPAVNLALTQQNLVDHLASDINDLPEGADVRALVSYQLVARLALQALQGGRWGDAPMLAQSLPEAGAWQFELRMERPDLGEGADSVQMLLSPVMASDAKPSMGEGQGGTAMDRHGLRPRDDERTATEGCP